MSKSRPSTCQLNSQEVRYKWAVLEIGRNSVSPWTNARTITCNKGIRIRFRKSCLPCQVKWHLLHLTSAAERRRQHVEWLHALFRRDFVHAEFHGLESADRLGLKGSESAIPQGKHSAQVALLLVLLQRMVDLVQFR